MAFSCYLPIVFGFAGATQAYTKFESKCSVPTDTANFVSSPDTRGTLDILWSCFFTIIACTWTIQHLNVPEQRGGRDPGIFGDIKWALKGSWTTTKWMLITILAPELLLGKALSDYFSARKSREKMKEFAVTDGVEWELCHGFFADMGGFKVRESPSVNPEAERTSREVSEEPPSKEIQQPKDSGTPLAVPSLTLYRLRKENRISRLPDITVSEINDKSKGNIFIKLIAIGQVLWNTIQTIVRASRGLTVTQLELAVTAFSVCAAIIYVLVMQKPQGVQTPARAIECNERSRINLEKWVLAKNVNATTLCINVIVIHPLKISTNLSWAYLPNDSLQSRYNLAFFAGSIIGGTVFGSIHTAGWNLSFQNPAELLLWRIASCCITLALPVIGICIVTVALVFSGLTESDPTPPGEVLVSFCNGIVALLYVFARLFLLVEYFRTLFFLPPDAYVSTWVSNIPHLA